MDPSTSHRWTSLVWQARGRRMSGSKRSVKNALSSPLIRSGADPTIERFPAVTLSGVLPRRAHRAAYLAPAEEPRSGSLLITRATEDSLGQATERSLEARAGRPSEWAFAAEALPSPSDQTSFTTARASTACAAPTVISPTAFPPRLSTLDPGSARQPVIKSGPSVYNSRKLRRPSPSGRERSATGGSSESVGSEDGFARGGSRFSRFLTGSFRRRNSDRSSNRRTSFRNSTENEEAPYVFGRASAS